MMTKRPGEFTCQCDVCGASETFHAHTHSQAWKLASRQAPAWAVRKNAFPIIHICPECPVDVAQKKAPSR
jgi:hypothetical protein